ncbi:MAG TPA: isocitrate/isopropylmalate dehydrogenase family protein [bacterium]|nr:isocitrate/isopropylmalate dehydrogenase family protein [bacterium]HOL54481.1 isocitrate/isopropylmalate dehydrogenase family protein [bacterium]HOP56195.1 isocitrate/isopropylmalate dehydrogenase family protein [bacterium]HPO81503.1 isocitrate/isopropylmalate dehydrogenase family protein [bacterium]HRR91840.1 isocitrate/isopropylmalate dehydrogenase family protein [bacterium]
MAKYRISLIKGDGTGPEIIEATMLVLNNTGLDIEWEECVAGEEALEKFGTPIPAATIESIKRNKVALKGPITTPVGTGFRSVNVALRQELGLFANVRPVRSFEGAPSRFNNIDLVVVRENTEDLYAGVEHYVDEDKTCAESIRIITRKASERIVRFAFNYARENGRKKVTAVHKANIMKFTDGLFLDIAREVAGDFPDIEFDDRIVDNMAMQLVKNPENFDVIVTTNLFGDILSDLCAGLVGGLGLAPGANIGRDYALFEAVHGSAPKYKGQYKVNPTAVILASAMMLGYLGEKDWEKRIVDAVAETIKEGKYVTYDLGGSASTVEMGRRIAEKLLKV